jgi:excinuclease ABC subunit C
MVDALLTQAAALPQSAGVYLFRDRRGRVLYIGKAVNLRARVRQYVSGHDERPMVPHLVARAATVEAIATRTEKEALLLENTLIKQHRPRYNIKLRDDSNFLHLQVDPKVRWPRFVLARQFGDKSKRSFGPFASASRARQTLAFVQRHFPLRTCTDQVLASRRRPCLLHQMGRCLAPCVDGHTTEGAYAQVLEDALMFLEGRHRPLVETLTGRMQEAADAEEFERAARMRDLIRAVGATLERQQVVDPRLSDRDVWAMHRDGTRGTLAVVPIREGAMGEPRVLPFDGEVASDAEIWSHALNTAYPEGAEIPPEILVPALPDDVGALAEVLSERRGRKVEVVAPVRGDRARLLGLAAENARVAYTSRHDQADRTRHALSALADLVGLKEPPARVECFDNSNLGGDAPVAAMTVLIDGKPAREAYRRYKVKTVVGNDDYATMREILDRRLRRGIAEGELPDLLVVDGGKGQVAVAAAVLADLDLDVPLVGIAKPRTEHARGDKQATDKIVLPGAKDPIRPPRNHPGLRLLQLVRDEAHAHAIGFHRKTRRQGALESVLDAIPGLGPARRKALLTHLGSAREVGRATPAQLAEVPGIGPAMAQKIHDAVRSPE